MSEHLEEPLNDGARNQRRGPKPPATQGGGAVYGLGVIGALVWFCRQAAEPTEYMLAVLKALVWPAFLVYRSFEVLHDMNTQGRSRIE